MSKANERILAMKFADLFPHYGRKAERKGRSREEVECIVRWLTGYDGAGLARQLERGVDVWTFFAEAPVMHPNRASIQGVVCGVRVETVEDPLMREIRYLDKLVDELAKGRAMEKILCA